MKDVKRWINFARWHNRENCIGKGKVLDCGFTEHTHKHRLYLKLEMNGIVYEGTLPVKVSEDEEE